MPTYSTFYSIWLNIACSFHPATIKQNAMYIHVVFIFSNVICESDKQAYKMEK